MKNLVPCFGSQATPDTAEALAKLKTAIEAAGGTFKVNSIYRDPEHQRILRERWEKWNALSAEQKKNVPEVAYAAKPGTSWHEAGRAVDLDTKSLRFPGIQQKDWIQKLWELAKPLGFTPIIAKPVFGQSECWHFEYRGTFKTSKAAIAAVELTDRLSERPLEG